MGNEGPNYESSEPFNNYEKLWLNDKFVEKEEYEEHKAKQSAELDKVSQELTKQGYYLSMLSNVLNKIWIPVILSIIGFFTTYILKIIFN